jgi:hypothetical protein
VKKKPIQANIESIKMKHYKLPENVLNGILDYMQTKPYKEVANGIYHLKSLKEIPQENECPENEPSKSPIDKPKK